MGDQTVELIYLGPSHGSGMVVMRVPKERILHTIDVVTPGRVAFRIMPDFFPQEWIKALTMMETLDYDQIIPGHGPASAPKSAVTEQRQYVIDLNAAVTAGTKVAGNPFALDKITEIFKTELRPKYGKWNQFDDWMGMNVERIILEQRIGWKIWRPLDYCATAESMPKRKYTHDAGKTALKLGAFCSGIEIM